MSSGPATGARNRSITGAAVTGASQPLFTDAGFGGINERWINNPSATATLWVNLFGEDAAANSAGSFQIPPGGGWSGKITSAINVIGVAGQAITAGER